MSRCRRNPLAWCAVGLLVFAGNSGLLGDAPETTVGNDAVVQAACAFTGRPAGEHHLSDRSLSAAGAPCFVVKCDGVPGLRLVVDAERGRVVRAGYEGLGSSEAPAQGLRLPGQPLQPVRDADRAREIATQWFRHAPVVEGFSWKRTGPSLAFNDEVWLTTWVGALGHTPVPTAIVDVVLDPRTGALVSYRVETPRRAWRPGPARLSEAQAVQAATRYCDLAPGYRLVGAREVFQVYRAPQPGGGRAPVATYERFWKVYFQGAERGAARYGFPREDGPCLAVVSLLDRTGLPDPEWGAVSHEPLGSLPPGLSVAPVAAPPQPASPSRIEVEDRAPVLGPGGEILFTTSRGGPFERRSSTLALLHPRDGIRLVVLDIPTWAPMFPALAPSGGQLAFGHQGLVYEVDLQTGALRTHTTAQRPGSAPAYHPNGVWLAIEAVRSAADQDLFLIDTARSLTSVQGQRRLARLPGLDALPAFSPDGRTLVFARHPEGADLGPWELWGATVGSTIAEVTNVRRIAGKLPAPGRLSWSADGRWVLWPREQPPECEAPDWWRIDVATGTTRSLPVPHLLDPEFTDRSLVPFQPVLAGNDEVVFEALHWSGKADEAAAWLLYRCRLDGQALRALTSPIAPHTTFRFPATGANGVTFPQPQQTAANDGK